ncbi:hypothetical protein, partial [Treponema sp. R6D11]
VGYAISEASNGGMTLPVSLGMLIYSHFKHVSGTPAPEGTQGVNINKLKILDTMIEQLSKMKNQPQAEFGNLDGSDEERINALIEQLQKQIKTAMSVGVYAPAAPATGALFNLAV